MSETAPPPTPPKTGCAKGCMGVIVALVIIAFSIGLWSWVTGDDVTSIPMHGEIVFARPERHDIDPVTCSPDGHTLVINAVGSKPTQILLGPGMRESDGSCVFAFERDVPDVDRYEFSLPGAGVKSRTIPRSLIDTIGESGKTELRVRLDW